MTRHPFWNISIYKILILSVLIANFLEANSLRQTMFAKMGWNTAAYWYAPITFLFILFWLVWGLTYLIEVSFGLTRGAFTIRSRAGVARWFDVVLFGIVLIVSYTAWVTNAQNVFVSDSELYSFLSDANHLFSPFLIWIIVCSIAGAFQSLSPWGEYRFDRSQDPVAVEAPTAPHPLPPALSGMPHEVGAVVEPVSTGEVEPLVTVIPPRPEEPIVTVPKLDGPPEMTALGSDTTLSITTTEELPEVPAESSETLHVIATSEEIDGFTVPPGGVTSAFDTESTTGADEVPTESETKSHRDTGDTSMIV